MAHWGRDAIGQALRSEQRVIYDNLSSLGADIPMCLSSRPLRTQGVGDEISFVDHLPDLPIVIVNPRIPVSTPEVFGRLKAKQNPPLPAVLPKWAGVRSFCEWLATTRNDLEEPAIALHPEIAGVLKVLSNVEKALFHRMSGSGATCFAIFDSADAATESMLKLKADFPNWWITGGWLCDCSAQLFVENP